MSVRDVLWVLVPTVIGIVVGLIVALAPGTQYAATAKVDAGPGTSSEDALQIPPDMQERFVQTEVAYVNAEGPQIAAAITAATGVADPPPVQAQQVAGTNIMAVTVTDANADLAARMANIAADVYVREWRTRTSAESASQVTALDEALATTAAELAKIPTTDATPEQQLQRDVLRSQLEELTTQRINAAAQVEGARTAPRLVSSATADSATQVTSTVRGAALGGLLGLLVGVALLLLVRQRRRIAETTSGPTQP